MQQEPPKTSRRTEERSDKPQVKAMVYTLDGLPVVTEAEVVEAVTDWTQPKIPVERATAVNVVVDVYLPMHRSRAPYRCGLFKTVYNCCETGFGCTQVTVLVMILCLKALEELHCTWLVPRTRASSDGRGLIGVRGHRIMLCGGTAALWRARRGLKLKLMLEFDSDYLVMGSGPCPSNPTVALCVSLHSGVEVALMYLDSLRIPSCARNPLFSAAYFMYIFLSVAPRLGSHFRTYSLVPRCTQIPYSVVVDLVVGLGIS
ncbi:hypothetical protein M9H77_06423 [Catharanthus roseus]|uniref:Uncharacterized protein n=1 Tax=Catharanthus roseus TaxID=4058 RepID=A0ACC0BS27_CATRO|nr:hypothetical protein M9H77_06423 [Catharanthus roseus]